MFTKEFFTGCCCDCISLPCNAVEFSLAFPFSCECTSILYGVHDDRKRDLMCCSGHSLDYLKGFLHKFSRSLLSTDVDSLLGKTLRYHRENTLSSITRLFTLYHVAEKFGEFGKSSVIHQTKPFNFVFKPGARRPQAGACLVSYN